MTRSSTGPFSTSLEICRHACPAQYAILADLGYFPKEELWHLRQFHSPLQGHPDFRKCPGVDVNTGSLGQGVAIAGGIALAAKHMLSYITAMFISQKPLSEEAEKAVRGLKFFRNYTFGVRGYSEARIVVFDLGRMKMVGNRAAKNVMKTYKKVLK